MKLIAAQLFAQQDYTHDSTALAFFFFFFTAAMMDSPSRSKFGNSGCSAAIHSRGRKNRQASTPACLSQESFGYLRIVYLSACCLGVCGRANVCRCACKDSLSLCTWSRWMRACEYVPMCLQRLSLSAPGLGGCGRANMC